MRSISRVPEELRNHEALTLVEASLLDLEDQDFDLHIKDSSHVVQCLGHAGIFGKPSLLCKESSVKVVESANRQSQKVKLVQLNGAAVDNPDMSDPPRGLFDRMVFGLLTLLLPPLKDSLASATYLSKDVGLRTNCEWVVVRPSFFDPKKEETEPANYEIKKSPPPLFSPGYSKMTNISAFMVELVDDDALWKIWVGKMPVVLDAKEVENI